MTATPFPRGLVLAALLALPVSGAAQSSPPTERWADANWRDDVVFAATNALLSGVVAGLFRTFSDHGSFAEGFRTGAAGGAVTYVGKRIAAERFGGAGLVGRQVASVGGSLAANARDGRGAFDRLTFQLGLGRLYWDRVESRVTVRPDLITLYYTALGVASSGVSLDWSRTVSAGAPIFITNVGMTSLDANAAGRAYGGVVVIDVNASLDPSEVAAHERVHILQYDHQFALWGEAAERGIVSLFSPRVSGVLGRFDMGIGLLPFVPLIGNLPRDLNPFEIEAEFLTIRGGS